MNFSTDDKKGRIMTRKEMINRMKNGTTTLLTVGDLKELLEKYPDDMPVVLPEADFDDGVFSLLLSHTQHLYVPETPYKGDIHGAKVHGVDDDEHVEVLVLWPH